MGLRAIALNAVSLAALFNVASVANAEAQNGEARQTSVTATRAFVRDSCPVLDEQIAIFPEMESSRSDGISALGLGAQFLTSLADTGWGLVANAFERAGRDATFSVDAGASFDFYQTYVGGDALAFTMRGEEVVVEGDHLTIGDQDVAPTRRYRCLILASGQFGYSSGPINMNVELHGFWQTPIVRPNAGETLQKMGFATAPDLYVEIVIMEDDALGAMAVQPILVRYARPLAGLRGNRELDATLSLIFSKTPTLARSTERDAADVFAALLIEFGAIRPGTLLGPLELSGAGVGGLPMRPTDDDAITLVREDFAAVSAGDGPAAESAAARRLALYQQGVGVGPVWVDSAFVVTRPGNPFMRAVGQALNDTRDEARTFVSSQLTDRVRRYDNRVSDRESARRAYELAMIDVQSAQLELAEATPGTADELRARRELIEKQYDARTAARAAGLPVPVWR